MKQDRSTVSRNSSFGISLRQAKHKPSEISMKERINTDTLPFRSAMAYSYDLFINKLKGYKLAMSYGPLNSRG